MRIILSAICSAVLVLGLFSSAFAGTADVLGFKSVVFPILSPRISSTYGKRVHPTLKFTKHHTGVDLAVPPLSHVRVVAAGRVIFADSHGGYGKLITVQHSNGYSSSYAHLDELRVVPGQTIQAGQVIGRVGSTGRSTGPHLHFEWRKDGVALDPMKVFPSLGTKAEG